MTIRPPALVSDMAVTLPHSVTANLRLLGTTDLHAHLLPYDYHADRGDQPFGLTRVATLIRKARAEVANVLLFDNGDALQGTPLGDLATRDDSDWRGPNPVIAAMNRLGYDAATLGNHEFNFGLDWLDRTLADARFPYSCGNVTWLDGAEPAQKLLAPYLLLRRMIRDDAGGARPLTVGVIGLVPPQITTWDHAHLSGRLCAGDMIEAAQRLVPEMRKAGADIVVMLAHSGIDTATPHPMMENAALPMAAIEGVDAIMAGHSHAIFPQPDCAQPDAPPMPGVDHRRGLLSDTPAVMAGARGSHLGVLDLRLELREGRWRVIGHRAEARPVTSRSGARVRLVPCDADLSRALAPAHRVTLAYMRRPIGRAATRLHSYLALVRPDPSVAALNAVRIRLLTRALAGSAYEGLPILAASAAYKTGGQGGPHYFTDLPEGPLAGRHATDLCPFPNHLCGLLITGAELRNWLERAAICFATIRPGAPEAMLRDYTVPGHDFDVIAGLTYRIDLSVPPRFNRHGAPTGSDTHRIKDLRHGGRPLQDDAQFVLATNSHRAFGAGAFAPRPGARIVHFSPQPIQDELVQALADTPLAAPPEHHKAWGFTPLPGTSVLLDTGPGLRRDPGALAGLNAEDLGLTPEGFWRLRLWL